MTEIVDRELFLSSKIMGQKVVSVEFVLNYLILRFNRFSINCYTWPEVLSKDNILNIMMSGYKDELCSIIGAHVTSVKEVINEYFQIDFDCNISIRVSLREDNLRGPEAAVLNNDVGGAEIVW